jgi:thioredoxin-related protein
MHKFVASIGLASALTLSPLPSFVAHAGEDSKGVQFMEGTPSFSDVLSKAKQDGKPVLINFQTPWCRWCRRLEKEVFPQPAVGDALKPFVNVSYDAQKGEGKALAERLHIQGFPTLVVVDASGNEIDRIEGFRPPDAFTKEIERIQKGEDTLPTLKKRSSDAPDDVEASMALARKLTVAAPADAVGILDKVVEKVKGKDRALEAEAWISIARAARNANDSRRAKAASDHVLAEFSDTPFAAEALQESVPSGDPDAALMFLSRFRNDHKNARVSAFANAVVAEVHLRAAAEALKHRAELSGDDAQTLNEVAWTCFEHKMNLKAAVGWARKAVELSKRDPAILDTLANLLFATGQAEEAVRIEQEALASASAEPLKSELGESLAKLNAAVAFRRDHPVAASAAAGEFDDASEIADESGQSTGSGQNGPTPPAR